MKKNNVEIVEYNIKKEYENNPLIRTLLYTEKLYTFMIKQNLSLLPTKVINVILSAIKQEQQPFIKNSDIITGNSKQLSFDDFFADWNSNSRALFTVSFKSIKLDKRIKNSELYNAFVALSNLNWEIYTDDKRGVDMLVPFIEGVEWTSSKKKKERYIQFKMHRKTLESLLDVSKFLNFENDFIMQLKSSKTLSFIFWASKHFTNGGTTIGVEKFCDQMNINYSYNSKVEEYLNRIRAEMNGSSFIFGMNYSIPKGGKLLKIQLFDKKEGVGITNNIDTLEDLQIKRALYHIKKTRNLNENQLADIEKKYRIIGYETLSKLIKRRIKKEVQGNDYIDEVAKIINGEI